MRLEIIRRRFRVLSWIARDFARHHQLYDGVPHRIAKGFAVPLAAESVDVGAQAQSSNYLRGTVGKRAFGG